MRAEYLYAGFGLMDFLFPNAREGVTGTVTTRVQDGCVPVPIPVCIPNYVDVPHPGTSDNVNGRKASSQVDLQLFKLGVNYRF